MGANDARTMTCEVSAAAKPPQTTPLYIGIRVDTREGNGECRRWRDSGRCAHLDVKMEQMTQETGKPPNCAAAAILAVPFPCVDTNAYIMGSCLRRFCRRRHFVRHCSRVICVDSPLESAFFILLATQVIGAKRAE